MFEVEVLRISKEFPSRALSGKEPLVLRGISAQLPPGKIIGILGPTESGKTTFMRILAGLLRPDRGEVLYKGGGVCCKSSQETAWMQLRRKISYMPEERGLYPNLSLAEQILYLLRLKGLSEPEAKEELERWRLRIGIEKAALQHSSQKLPRNIQQKAFLILVLAADPELLILDDPFAGLDPVTILDMEELFRELAQKGTTIIFSTPRLEEADSLCEYVLMMNKGRLLVEGATEQVRRKFARPEYELVVSTPVENLEWPAEVTVQPLTSHKARISLSDPAYVRSFLEKILPQTDVHLFQEQLPSLKEVFKELEERNLHYMS